jgi:hypothetical protein
VRPRAIYPVPLGATLWNSLEVVKLVVALITPVVVLLLGIWVTRLAKRFEQAQWANQKVIEKRLAIYDELSPSLNDVYCYFTRVGSWNERSPDEIVALKRSMDRTANVYRYLFTPAFWDAYQSFIAACYETYTGAGRPARLRTSPDGRARERWGQVSEQLFSPIEQRSSPLAVRREYFTLMDEFAKELGVGLAKFKRSASLPAIPSAVREAISSRTRRRPPPPVLGSSAEQTSSPAKQHGADEHPRARRPPP